MSVRHFHVLHIDILIWRAVTLDSVSEADVDRSFTTPSSLPAGGEAAGISEQTIEIIAADGELFGPVISLNGFPLEWVVVV